MSEASAPPDAVLYDERLWPTPFVWLIIAGVAGASILVFAPISILTGIIACIVIFFVLVVLLILSTPRITVTTTSLSVGRAHIDREFLGPARAYMKHEATRERGPRLNGLAYLCLRGWIDPVVRIEIEDEDDPTPYWLVSTRRPIELVNALSPEKPGHENSRAQQNPD
ncbi:Protein of unknown function [Arthrobacter subterraneus]|uniref:DUF3093 domain-containing protein n=1 Tax=Arthrobacter subterraneus TaxID=335973 RepID=A0A1G8P1W6_9MICC|nr:DUF3093 domain-containing protein [Arthrobacter subterraneus]SDI86449.1 Protein of unknown function [Arthrobacter subterraneus]